MKQTKRHQLDGLLALLLFGVFAACILSVLLAGAGAYRRLTTRDSISYSHRTAAQYLTTRVRQADAAGLVAVAPFDAGIKPDSTRGLQGSMLVLSEEIDGTMYDTLIYCHDGYIRELFSAGDWEMSPEDGEKVLEALGLTFRQSGDGLLTAEITHSDGFTEQVILALRSGEEGPA